MKEIAVVERKKEVYEVSNEDFIKGDWLKKVETIHNDGYSFEITYINNHLIIKKYSFEGKEYYKKNRDYNKQKR